MKKSYVLQSLFVACMLVFSTLTAHAELLLNENFEYSTGNLYQQGTAIDPTGLGWIRYSTHSTNPIQVVDGALSYAGYQDKATGKVVKITNGSATDEDLQLAFSKDPITSGSFYAAMLVNITDAGQGDKPAYFIAFTGKTSKGWVDGVNATEYGRVFSIKSENEGKFQLGISKNNANQSVTTEDLDLGKTYLLVLKYEFVDGATNDITSLWVNPTDFKAEPATTLIGAITQGDASTTNGLQGIEIRQGQNFERLTPTATIDAVRVATAWEDLFSQAAGGDDPDPVLTPAITVNPTKIDFQEYFYVGGPTASYTINVKAENLTEDIAVAVSSDQHLQVSSATISKEDAMSETGANIDITFTPVEVEAYGWNGDITFTSNGAATISVPVKAYVSDAVANIAEMQERIKQDGWFAGVIRSQLEVTYTYMQANYKYFYVQDESAAWWFNEDQTYSGILKDVVSGDRLLNLSVANYGNECYIEALGGIGENAPIEPTDITLEDLTTNLQKYAYRLVRVNDVTFSQTGEFAASTQYDIAQAEATAKLSLFAGSDIIGTTIPAKADIIGIVRNTTSKLISPRTTDDIIAKANPGTGIDNLQSATIYTEAGAICIQPTEATHVVIYNLLGAKIAELNATEGVSRIDVTTGTYIVRIGNKAMKMVVK